MSAIKDILAKYHSKIAALDLELLIASTINKPREFVLAHPEYKIPVTRNPKLEAWIKRRMEHEPIAYILGQKEFYGLNFRVNKNTLIPRPETELLVEKVISYLQLVNGKNKKITIVDIGTGSGNIIITLAKLWTSDVQKRHPLSFYGIDISAKALAVAQKNSTLHKVNKAIKFLQGSLLEPILKNTRYQIPDTRYLVVANLPYLSKSIYAGVSRDIKKYEPKSALLSGKNGLAHYEKLLIQIKKLSVVGCRLSVFMEISPEQKSALQKLLKSFFLKVKIAFHRDLSGRWRVCQIEL